jgi:hypothetical protein
VGAAELEASCGGGTFGDSDEGVFVNLDLDLDLDDGPLVDLGAEVGAFTGLDLTREIFPEGISALLERVFAIIRNVVREYEKHYQERSSYPR